MKRPEPIKLFSFRDDQTREQVGLLIPNSILMSQQKRVAARVAAVRSGVRMVVRTTVTVAAMFLLVVLGTAGYGLVAQSDTLVATPALQIAEGGTASSPASNYGPQPSLATPSVFTATRDQYIDEAQTFIEADLSAQVLRYFESGVLAKTADILAVGAEDSWWDTPSGLYQVEGKDERGFSHIAQVYLPWRLTFQGNFTIHGWPTYTDGTPIESEVAAGGIRLSTADAEELFALVLRGTPIIVHEASAVAEADTFVYQPNVSELVTPHYLMADLKSGTVLAAADIDSAVPIASVTKLMTAVVASERLDLDARVQVASPSFVTSLIPRLAERSSVSMYSLLQLLLVESSNEAAETIAGEFGREEFMAAMNAKARQLGMLDTHFEDPSGLSAQNVSSVNDLYRLATYIYNDRRFIFEITAHNDLSYSRIANEFGGLVNFNEIENMDSFVGGKVGETSAAGQTSVSIHKVTFGGEERYVVVVLLNSAGRTADIRALLNYATTHYNRE